MILLHLIKTNIAYQLNRSEKESASISELMKVTGGKPSSTAARLSELVDIGWVDRVGRGEYRVTTYGTVSFVETSLPKIKSTVAE
jgi:predicted transcriptional regulator of viral defense system